MLFERLCFADFLSSEFAKTTALPYNSIMEFIEATAFAKYVYDYLTEDEYLGLQSFLLQNPEAGKIVRGSGGVRKVRWAITGKGKKRWCTCDLLLQKAG